MKHHNYYVYILTNYQRTTLYIGVTNNLRVRLSEHQENARCNAKSFTGRYRCTYLVYYEYYQWIQDAIDREKQLKRWSRAKKEYLITEFNPGWTFLNDIV